MTQAKRPRIAARRLRPGFEPEGRRNRHAVQPVTPGQKPREYAPTFRRGETSMRQGSGSDTSVDEETGARSRRPGGPADVSFGSNDEGPEGPTQ